MPVEPKSFIPEVLTFEQVAVILKVTPQTVARYTKRDQYPLKFFYLNPEDKQQPRIKLEDLKEFIQSLDDPRVDI